MPAYDKLEAVAPTGYVPGWVPAGGVSVIVREPLPPGLMVIEPTENAAAHPVGWLDEGENVLAEHPAESLLVTVAV